MDWDLISFITSSKIRFKVLITLNKSPITPTDLSKKLNLHNSAISRALNELSKKDLIDCLTNKRTKSKYYKISQLGKELLEKINKETEVKFK